MKECTESKHFKLLNRIRIEIPNNDVSKNIDTTFMHEISFNEFAESRALTQHQFIKTICFCGKNQNAHNNQFLVRKRESDLSTLILI